MAGLSIPPKLHSRMQPLVRGKIFARACDALPLEVILYYCTGKEAKGMGRECKIEQFRGSELARVCELLYWHGNFYILFLKLLCRLYVCVMRRLSRDNWEKCGECDAYQFSSAVVCGEVNFCSMTPRMLLLF